MSATDLGNCDPMAPVAGRSPAEDGLRALCRRALVEDDLEALRVVLPDQSPALSSPLLVGAALPLSLIHISEPTRPY